MRTSQQQSEYVSRCFQRGEGWTEMRGGWWFDGDWRLERLETYSSLAFKDLRHNCDLTLVVVI